MNRRLLMVAYHFPPVGGAGVERTLKHAAYLPARGWQPVVVAPRNSAYRIVVPESVERIPRGTEVHRALTIEPAHLRRAAAWFLRRGGPRRAEAESSAGGRAPGSTPQTAAGALRRSANAAWGWLIPKLFFPDEQLLWIPAAILAGERANRAMPVEAIYSSGPPVSTHLAAAVLARRLAVPWVADFRDPWLGNAFARALPPPHRALQRQLEAAIVRGADRVLFATATWRGRYALRYPDRAARFIHVPNGYDPTELGGGADDEPRTDSEFRLIYAGSIYGDRELELFLDGVEVALGRSPELRDRLRVEFVGILNAHNQAIARERGPALARVVRFTGLQPRPSVIDMERRADAGLILIAADPGRDADVNAKLYEYLGLDLPVLAVAPDGETRATLRELDWGVGVDPEPEAIAGGLGQIMAMPRPDRPADPDGRYDRRNLAERLADILDEVVGPAAP